MDRALKEQHIMLKSRLTSYNTSIFEFSWISTNGNELDVFAKNFGGPEYNEICHEIWFVDNYYINKRSKTPAHEHKGVTWFHTVS